MAVDRLKMLRILPTDSLQSPSSLPLQGLQSLPCALPVQQAVHLRPAELQDRAPEDAQLSDAGCRTHALHEVSVSRKNPDDPFPQPPPSNLLLCLSICPCVRKANILVSFLLDVALGVLLMSWLYRDDHIAMLANALVPAADVSEHVQ